MHSTLSNALSAMYIWQEQLCLLFLVIYCIMRIRGVNLPLLRLMCESPGNLPGLDGVWRRACCVPKGKGAPLPGQGGERNVNYPASSTRNPRRISRVSCKQVFSAFLYVTNRYRNLLKQWPLGLNMFLLKSQLTMASSF
jgi:hypothetical protein